MKRLFLASQSASRKELLTLARIPFSVIEQRADEAACDWNVPIKKLVATIAKAKMDCVIMPTAQHDGETVFVITADTLSQSSDGTINGKPIDRQDAHLKIAKARQGNYVHTAFCVAKKRWQQDRWIIEELVEQTVSAYIEYEIPDNEIDYYLDNSLGLSAAGAIAVEGFGSQFFKCINGSYTAVMGLPLFEVRCVLQRLGFFE
jgi:septum formation protein